MTADLQGWVSRRHQARGGRGSSPGTDVSKDQPKELTATGQEGGPRAAAPDPAGPTPPCGVTPVGNGVAEKHPGLFQAVARHTQH